MRCTCDTGYEGDSCDKCAKNYYSSTKSTSADNVCVDACTALVMYADAKHTGAISDAQKRGVCNGHGTCRNMNPERRGRGLAVAKEPKFGTDVACDCDKGYAGDSCDKCAASFFSSLKAGGNTATCVDACTAAAAYGDKCGNGSTCVNGPKKGRRGRQLSLAAANPVLNTDYHCVCKAAFTGHTCTGCSTGYKGTNCELCADGFYTSTKTVAADKWGSTTCVDGNWPIVVARVLHVAC